MTVARKKQKRTKSPAHLGHRVPVMIPDHLARDLNILDNNVFYRIERLLVEIRDILILKRKRRS